jgi:asparagine synthase (glutamine-hydrolysing)
MVGSLAHRGPDDEGYYWGTGIALGFRRLAVIDLQTGHQPMANEDQSIWVVFNGEIYNFRDLRRRLEGSGHRFRTSSDTEVLLHLYEDEGPSMVRYLRGMFAFALWDSRQRRLMLARDRLGKKPLVYRLEPERILFASELKAILQDPEVPREVDPTSVDFFLTYQYVPYPRTIFRGIHKLPPAHYAIWSHGTLKLYRYWEPPFDEEVPGTPESYRERLREALTDATLARLVADVPIGAFLSGGIDSTITVGLMQRVSGQKVRTFCIGFPVADFDERHYAAAAARHLGTIHEELVLEPNCVEILPKLIWHYDEPFGDSSAIPTFLLSRWVREHVTVALTGDGGDELFAGYPRYRAVKLATWFDRLPGPVRWLVANPLWRFVPASSRQKAKSRQLKKLMQTLRTDPHRRYLKWVCIFDEPLRGQLYTDDFAAQLTEDPAEFLLGVFRSMNDRDLVTQTMNADLVTYLSCDLLTKVDIASMAHGLECRCPFLDHHVVELALRMPVHLKMKGLSGKRILKEAFDDLLPPLLKRRPKMGFGVPLDSWFRGPLAELLQDVLLDTRSRQRGYFEPACVRQLIDEHLSGRWDHSYRLWCLLVLELWHRKFADVPQGVPVSP